MATSSNLPKTSMRQMGADNSKQVAVPKVNPVGNPSDCPMSKGEPKVDQNANIPKECPMHNKDKKEAMTDLSSRASECPMNANYVPQYQSECPSKQGDNPSIPAEEVINPENMMPPPNQRPAPDQPFELPTNRVTSSIPKASENKNWVYPSPQMLFNAMLRKGHRFKEDDIQAVDIQNMTMIHNANNEAAWREILAWEALVAGNCKQQRRLARFSGDATKFTPKARFRNKVLGYELPFDRHDWIIDRCGKEVRYVIDYYDGDLNKENYEFATLDIRPALDRFRSVYERSYIVFRRYWDPVYYGISDKLSFSKPQVDAKNTNESTTLSEK